MEIIRTEVNSQVSAVTVYQGRAMITRSTTVSLKSGNHVLVFAGLPAEIDRDSIQVKGKGEATLGECVYETEYFSENVDERKRSLEDNLQDLEDRLEEIGYNLSACDKEKNLLDKIANFVTAPIVQSAENGNTNIVQGNSNLDASAWEKMLSFYHNQNIDIDQKKLQAAKDSRELENEIEKIQAELDSLGYAAERSINIIKVSVTKEKEGELSLELSYVISGPYWRPVYNLRASSDSDTIIVEYDALVNQATGEDWENAALKLSTARVNVSGALPELYPWRLSFYRPMPMRAMAKSKKRIDEMDEEEELYDEMEMAKSTVAESAPAPEPEQEIDYDEAEVETGGTSVVFSISGGSNIIGDNNDTRVTIMRKELPSDFLYMTVPKLAEFAYLTGKMKNTTEFPLLQGKANIFFDSSFVSISEIPLLMPDQELEVSLGVDEGVGVEYRFLKRFTKNEGLMSKKISEQFEYQIRITNNRKKKIEIKIFDQFPISEEKDILVKAISPVIKDGKKDITMDDESKIQWNFEIAPGEKKELPYSFLVEYPPGRTLSGL